MRRKTATEYRASILKIQHLYSTPQVLSKALRLMQQLDVNLDSVIELIRHDASLTADLIHVSNSALFCRGQRHVDLAGAMQRLGLREVLRVVGLSLSKNLFGKGLSNYGVSSQEYWKTSVLGALLMEAFARRHNIDPMVADTVGILHALGRVLINEVLEEVGSKQVWSGEIPMEYWELESVGFSYAEAGALLLRQWDFPDSICEPIENQLEPITAVVPNSIDGLIRLTVHLLYQNRSVDFASDWTFEVSEEILKWAGFKSEEELRKVVLKAQKDLLVVESQLGAP